MKSRGPKEGGESSGGGGGDDAWKKKKRKKNERRLGGGKGLSLQSFANAKSRSSGYNPAIIKKQREFYRNAKYLNKFKKSIKREGQAEVHIPPAASLEDGNNVEHEQRSKAKKKKKTNLQVISQEVEKMRKEAEKARMEREARIQAQKEERARVEARRKAQREKMFKKTRSGQPVMKYRIEHLLQGILNDSSTN